MNPTIHPLGPGSSNARDMVRFSVGGDEGEGSRSPRPKRPRFTPRFTIRCNNRSHPQQRHEDREPPVDLEGEGRGDEEIWGNDADLCGDVDDDEEEEEGDDDEDDGTHERDEELDPVDQDNSVVIESIANTNNQSRVGGEGGGGGGQGQVQRLDGGCSTAQDVLAVPGEVRHTAFPAPVSVILSDPEVLDCTICCEPLAAPVFQCENGHVACSSCCIQLHNKCPTCSMPIGYYRCRAFEKVLESIKMGCQNANYGCKELLNYGKKNEHENTCKHMPCSCPHLGCKYTASSFALVMHLSSKHLSNIYVFQYNKVLRISVPVASRTFILQGEYDNVLFIVKKNVDRLGSIVTLSCIGPHMSKEGYRYILMVKSEDSLLSVKSTTKAMQGKISYVPCTVFLLVPNDFCGTRQHIDFSILISNNGTLRAIDQWL